jgi:hypothetical protein
MTRDARRAAPVPARIHPPDTGHPRSQKQSRVVSASREIPAGPGRIFELIADPAQQSWPVHSVPAIW